MGVGFQFEDGAVGFSLPTESFVKIFHYCKAARRLNRFKYSFWSPFLVNRGRMAKAPLYRKYDAEGSSRYESRCVKRAATLGLRL